MKNCFIILFILLPLHNSAIWSQDFPGAPKGKAPYSNSQSVQGLTNFIFPENPMADSFATSVYTFNNITIFSYFDNTQVKVYSQAGNLIGSKTMKADTIYNLNPGSGIYRIVGNTPYTVLVGDAISNYVNGYFAVDEAGRGVSTKLNTWMMSGYQAPQDEFAIFAYEDNTSFTVKNLVTGNIIRAGVLNAGQHYSFNQNGPIPYSTPLQITGSKGISALSYTDQDYYVPSSTGRFIGKLFYGFSAYEGSWTNSITITSYSDNNTVNVTNTTTGASLGSFTMGRGQVKTIPVSAPTYWRVVSTGPVSAANIPYAGWSGSYYYMTRAIDETGVGAGKFFYVPSISSRIDVFSFENTNTVTITQLGTIDQYPYATPVVVWTGNLNANQNYNFTSQSGNYVYKIEGTKNLSVVQSNGGAGADFMPLSYALSLPDLAISNSDILFSIPDSVYVAGDQITVTVKVHNRGTLDASNIQIAAYDGDPDFGTAPVLANGTITSISAGDSVNFSFLYIVPMNPQYRSIVVKIDPSSLIVEANKSNNKASRFLRPNRDLQPPLAVNVTAPSGLTLLNGQPAPNPFTVKFDVFNTGTVSAANSKLILNLKNGLKLLSGIKDTTVNLGNIAANQSASYTVRILVTNDSSGFNFYSASVSADNATLKVVSRAVNVPDGIAPAVPSLLTAVNSSGNCAQLTWNANTEKDLAGYMVYYTTDSTNYSQNQPVVVVSLNNVTKCGLSGTTSGVMYYFKLKAYDSSNNLSGFSLQKSVLIKSIVSVRDLNVKPDNFELCQNYPNPFNPSTVITYKIPEAADVLLKVFDVLGNEITTLVNERQHPGTFQVTFDAAGLSNGIYFYSIQANNFREVKKLVLVK